MKHNLQETLAPDEWEHAKPLIQEIEDLKAEKNAVILAHNYQVPEIFYGVADIVGDSLALAQKATQVKAERIIQCGVHFMAETSKILNPHKKVLLPDLRAGCSLAESITGEDVRALKRAYPNRPIVTYVNTSAEVKSESDICCTSSNAKKIVESLGVPEVIFLPDKYLAQNVASQTSVKIIAWHGVCEVHKRFTQDDISQYRNIYHDLVVIAHPECSPQVVKAADFSGSTAGMIDWIKKEKPHRVFLVTECSMSNNVALAFPETNFIRPCYLCPHMGRITLESVRNALRDDKEEILVPDQFIEPAKRAILRMLDASK